MTLHLQIAPVGTATGVAASEAHSDLAQGGWIPVRPEQVHKLDPDAVVLADWTAVGPDAFAVRTTAGQATVSTRHAAGLMDGAEMLRQAVILISHAAYAVPADAAFVMNGLAFRRVRDLSEATGSATRIELRCHDVAERAGALRSMRVELEFWDVGGVFATGTGLLTVLPERVYRRLRGPALRPVDYVCDAPRVPAASVGCDHDGDVVLTPDGAESWSLALDTANRRLFDHGGDHVPGMVLIEAACQAYAATGAADSPAEIEAHFERYVEFEPAAELRLQAEPGGVVITVHQDDEPAATIRLNHAA